MPVADLMIRSSSRVAFGALEQVMKREEVDERRRAVGAQHADLIQQCALRIICRGDAAPERLEPLAETVGLVCAVSDLHKT